MERVAILVAIYEIFIDIDHLNKHVNRLWWNVDFNKEWKEKSVVDLGDSEMAAHKWYLDKKLKYPFPGRNLLLRIDDDLVLHLDSFLEIDHPFGDG